MTITSRAADMQLGIDLRQTDSDEGTTIIRLTFDIAETNPGAVGQADRMPETTRAVDRTTVNVFADALKIHIDDKTTIARWTFHIAEAYPPAEGVTDRVPEVTIRSYPG